MEPPESLSESAVGTTRPLPSSIATSAMPSPSSPAVSSDSIWIRSTRIIPTSVKNVIGDGSIITIWLTASTDSQVPPPHSRTTSLSPSAIDAAAVSDDRLSHLERCSKSLPPGFRIEPIQFFKGLSVTEERRKYFRKALHTYYDAAVELLQLEHNSLRQVEYDNGKILNAKGEPGDVNASSYEKLWKSYDHLQSGVSALAEALDLDTQVMPEDGCVTRLTSGEEMSSPRARQDSSVVEAVWDDKDTRAFYEFLPDLRAFVPAVLLGEAGPKVNDQSPKAQEQQTVDLAPESYQAIFQDSVEVNADIPISEEGKNEDNKDDENTKDSDKDKAKEKDTKRRGEIEKEKVSKGVEGTSLDGLLQWLPGCVSRDLIVQLTVEFCYVSPKSSRKKLVRGLFSVPSISLQLCTVATLSTCMKDIPAMLLQLLKEEFNFLINKKDQINIESKIRNIRFIDELCKFKTAPAGLVFSCLKEGEIEGAAVVHSYKDGIPVGSHKMK